MSLLNHCHFLLTKNLMTQSLTEYAALPILALTPIVRLYFHYFHQLLLLPLEMHNVFLVSFFVLIIDGLLLITMSMVLSILSSMSIIIISSSSIISSSTLKYQWLNWFIQQQIISALTLTESSALIPYLLTARQIDYTMTAILFLVFKCTFYVSDPNLLLLPIQCSWKRKLWWNHHGDNEYVESSLSSHREEKTVQEKQKLSLCLHFVLYSLFYVLSVCALACFNWTLAFILALLGSPLFWFAHLAVARSWQKK